MSEDLIKSVADQLSPPVTPVMSVPVTREPNRTSAEAGEGADLSFPMVMGAFAPDDAD
jgi:hypothetical protein